MRAPAPSPLHHFLRQACLPLLAFSMFRCCASIPAQIVSEATVLDSRYVGLREPEASLTCLALVTVGRDRRKQIRPVCALRHIPGCLEIVVEQPAENCTIGGRQV